MPTKVKGTLSMHSRLSVLAAGFVWLGCMHCSLGGIQSVGDSSTRLMTEFGEISPAGTSWTVNVSAADRKVHFIRHNTYVNASGSSEVIPSGWKANTGWLAFVENDVRAWAYDGDNNLILIVALGTKGEAIYCAQDLPCAVPDEVFARLSPAMRETVKPQKK
jgi:hypothetical protein